MKRFLSHIILYIALFAIVYPLGIFLVGSTPLHGNITFVPANYGHLRSRIADIPRHKGVDILFLGSSHCYRTFDPRPFAAAGISTFNLGSSNQTPIQTLALLETYLDSLQPKRVLFEVHPDIMGNSGEEAACDLLSNMPINRPLRRMAWQVRSPRVINTALYAWMRSNNTLEDSIIIVNTDVNGEQVPCPFAYIRGGFVELPLHRYRPQPLTPQQITINPKQLQALDDCLNLLASRNIPVTLIEVPASRTLYQSYTNHNTFERLMSQRPWADQYLNLNGLIPFTDTLHFFDPDHLNQEGVAMLNKYLISCIL